MALRTPEKGSSAMKHLLAPAILTATALFALASPAAAQSADEKINMVIAYNEAECPVAQPGEVVVCEILVEEERYRIPRNLRYSDNPANQSLARQVDQIKYVGDFGAMSCEPAGAGGFTGCNQKFVEAWAKDKDEAEAVRFGQLIEKARQDRLSNIDAEAAAQQERVEMIEREYMKRLEKEREGEVPGEGELPPPPK
jgi:hypothetical protein